ncbi:MAG: hypothetical protein HFH46_00810 [Bacilli bacterium]|nr:hypothetical protein [Bacilli bacterium]
MKKLICLILTLFFINSVQAMEYTEYGEFGPYIEEYIQSDNLTDVKVERRYKYYKLIKEYGEYSRTTNQNYPYLDKDDYIYTNASTPNIIKPEEKEDRIIEELDGYHYKKIKDINYITIDVSRTTKTLSKIEFLYKGEKLDYTTKVDTSQNDIIINDGQSITFHFKENIRVYDLIMSFEVKDGNDNGLFIRIGNNNEEYLYTILSYELNKTNTWIGKTIRCYNSAFEDYYSTEKIESTYIFKLIKTISMYTYKDKLYHTYNLTKDYYEEYLSKPFEDYIHKDETKYKDYYAKRTRNIISEYIIKTNNEEKKTINKKQKLTTLNTSSKTKQYATLEKTQYYPVKLNKEKKIETQDSSYLLYTFIPFILILVILILVLSKLYKKKRECAKVKTG